MDFYDCKFIVEGERKDGEELYKKGETGEKSFYEINFGGPNDKTTWKFIQATTF